MMKMLDIQIIKQLQYGTNIDVYICSQKLYIKGNLEIAINKIKVNA